MDIIQFLFDFVLHLDENLRIITENYGTWTYAILFFIIFMETGFVVTPFLPGDSLLFAAGSIAALGSLNPVLLFFLLTIAGIIGDTVNYWIGHYVGPRAFSGDIRFLKKEYLDRTHVFYEKHGGKTIFLARFIPIIRTFAPFVAGIGAMTYWKFITYNVVGAITWVGIFIFGGYFFGNIPFVRNHFEIVIFTIIAISFIPAVVEFLNARREIKKEKAQA
jgi:membrane-associated protein